MNKITIVTFGLMARAATVGGEIRHPEIRSSKETINATSGSQTEWLNGAGAVSDDAENGGSWQLSLRRKSNNETNKYVIKRRSFFETNHSYLRKATMTRWYFLVVC